MTLEVTQEPVQVTTRGYHAVVPDWTFTDAHGHLHDASLETCEWVVVSTYWCDDCRDDHDESELRCRQCGELIVPQRRWTGEQTELLPGLRTITLTVLENGVERQYLLSGDILFRPDEGLTDKWLDLVLGQQPAMISERFA